LLGGLDVTGNAADEEISDSLIEDLLDRNA
jgi:hypothetical protein